VFLCGGDFAVALGFGVGFALGFGVGFALAKSQRLKAFSAVA
jgi:hypothetical protein